MTKVALLIGVSEYEPGLNPLPSAARDIEAMQAVLLNPEIGGFAETDVIALKNPDRQIVEEAIERLFTYRQKDDLVLLYFSGHSIKDDLNNLYLSTRTTRKNSNGELVRSTAVAAKFVQQCMGLSRSRRQVIILDSCFSGAFAEGMSAKDDGAIDIREQLGGEGRAVLTSCSSTQYSFEQQSEDLSIYTRFLIEGITTGAADRDEDEFITIDELHDYASQKVREFQPAMKPEIYAIREGFKIRLAKVAPGDPAQRYRKEVARFIHRGEISFVGRRTLDVLRSRLDLEAAEAKAIEDAVLEPCRIEFREKLQQYQQVFTELLDRDETITEGDRADLQNLQQILGLRNEDTMPIEAEVAAQFKAHQQALQTYEQAFGSAVWQEYPLSAAERDRLQPLRQNLTTAEVEAIELRITAEVEAYHQKLQEYDRLFTAATQQEYPLNEATRADLRQQQQRLGLKDAEIAPIEAKITTQIETYHQKLQQYEQAYVKATQRKYQPNEVTRTQLRQTWQTLGLSQDDVEAIESRINGAIETHQANLRQYEQVFTEAVQQEYPLNTLKRAKLTQRYQGMNLTTEDVKAIEHPIVKAIESHRQKLEQYDQVFREAIQFEYPPSNETRKELQRFQRVLELSGEDVVSVENQLLSLRQAERNTSERPEQQPISPSTTSSFSTPPAISQTRPKARPTSPVSMLVSVVALLGMGGGLLAYWLLPFGKSNLPTAASSPSSLGLQPASPQPSGTIASLKVAERVTVRSPASAALLPTLFSSPSLTQPLGTSFLPVPQPVGTIPRQGILEILSTAGTNDASGRNKSSWVQVRVCSTNITSEPKASPGTPSPSPPLSSVKPGTTGWIEEAKLLPFVAALPLSTAAGTCPIPSPN